MKITRHEILKFYENKIDDVADDKTREKCNELWGQLDELLFDLDWEIEKDLEEQENSKEEPCYDMFNMWDEFNYMNRMC